MTERLNNKWKKRLGQPSGWKECGTRALSPSSPSWALAWYRGQDAGDTEGRGHGQPGSAPVVTLELKGQSLFSDDFSHRLLPRKVD